MSPESVRAAPVNISAALSSFDEQWQPHRLATVNDQDVKLARIEGEFVWHAHPDSDELFLVVSGSVVLQLRDGDVELGPQDVFVVPRGVEHCPKSVGGEAVILMVEQRGTVNTGGDRTAEVRELS